MLCVFLLVVLVIDEIMNDVNDDKDDDNDYFNSTASGDNTLLDTCCIKHMKLLTWVFKQLYLLC